jgi:hypothetical protein
MDFFMGMTATKDYLLSMLQLSVPAKLNFSLLRLFSFFEKNALVVEDVQVEPGDVFGDPADIGGEVF